MRWLGFKFGMVVPPIHNSSTWASTRCRTAVVRTCGRQLEKPCVEQYRMSCSCSPNSALWYRAERGCYLTQSALRDLPPSTPRVGVREYVPINAHGTVLPSFTRPAPFSVAMPRSEEHTSEL